MTPIEYTVASRLGRLFKRFRLLPSTKMCLHEARHIPEFSLLEYLHGYIYAHWPYWYISVGTGEHRSVRLFGKLLTFVLNLLSGFPKDHPVVEISGVRPGRAAPRLSAGSSTFADTYHGKVLRLESAKKLISVNREIQLGDLERVLPYSQARDLILREPDRIVVADCPCRACRANPCQPLDVCLIVGEPFASFAVEHHPDRTRRVSVQEALDILQSEAERGHVHHAFFKQALLNRFFAICSCCSCCCGAIQLHRNGIQMLASSGYVAKIEKTSCVGCGTCIERCQFKAITVADGLANIDSTACMGCGVCTAFCPQDAVVLVRDPSSSPPLDLDELLAQSPDSRHRRYSRPLQF